MIPVEIEQLWEDYVAAERVRVRHEALRALERFIEALLRLPAADWHPWARQLSHRLIDAREDIPVRFPFFREVLFPALLAGLEDSVSGSARWLAGFAQLLYKSPACRDRLPENLRSEFDLLERAIHDDPSDTAAKKRLLSIMRSRFDYALHELPTGVLYGHNGATVEECAELLEELSAYERLSIEMVAEEEDRELIAQARFHIPAYRRYLSESHPFRSYEAFLAANERG